MRKTGKRGGKGGKHHERRSKDSIVSKMSQTGALSWSRWKPPELCALEDRQKFMSTISKEVQVARPKFQDI